MTTSTTNSQYYQQQENQISSLEVSGFSQSTTESPDSRSPTLSVLYVETNNSSIEAVDTVPSLSKKPAITVSPHPTRAQFKFSQSKRRSSSGAGSPSSAISNRVVKSKFTPEDDELLIELKERRKLSWRIIAQHFPGRTAGALQVRYCTKLKMRLPQWTQEDVEKLKTAINEYDSKKWEYISGYLNNKFCATSCKNKHRLLVKQEKLGMVPEGSGPEQEHDMEGPLEELYYPGEEKEKIFEVSETNFFEQAEFGDLGEYSE